MLEQAVQFATKMHQGQVRKYTHEPYITHPVAVADLVEEYMDARDYTNEEVMTAMVVAVLHDTVEDTEATMEDIEQIFGTEVARGVWFLTKCPDYVGNRATRKMICQERLARAPEIIRVIKAFDMKHNMTTLERDDPKFYKTFVVETEALLVAMDMVEVFAK